MATTTNLQKLAQAVRHHILTATTKAGSGHPTSSLSAVELTTTLFFGGFLHQDLDMPHAWYNDRFILSKGHASPLLYSLYRVAGVLSDDDLDKLRDFGSRLEGHPTPLFPYHEVETGSLGQGLSIGLGMALGIKLQLKMRSVKAEREPKVFVLMGDSEQVEGQVWEAMELASHYKVNNLVGILDVNRLGQRGETMLGWDVKTYAKRAESFGWVPCVIEDGHDINKIQKAFQQVQFGRTKPHLIIAKTIKGKGVSFLENQDDWHGKVVPPEKLEESLKELGNVDENIKGDIIKPSEMKDGKLENKIRSENSHSISHSLGSFIATREAYGDGLVTLGHIDPTVVVLDAEVSNSTYADKFKKVFPERFFEMYIAEQNMVSVALGLSKLGFKPYVSSFAAFLTRAHDQIRMSQYSYGNIVFCGSHAGVSIGQDGSSQMGLEDLSMFQSVIESAVVYPSDATSATKLLETLHHHNGISYIRTTREKTPVIYEDSETFHLGGSKILHSSPQDRVVVFAAGITLHEALKAYEELQKEQINIAVVDLYSVKPVDKKTIHQFGHLPIIVVEDHYPTGGLGEAVLTAFTHQDVRHWSFTHLCVNKIPHSGKPVELLAFEQIDTKAIIEAVKKHQL